MNTNQDTSITATTNKVVKTHFVSAHKLMVSVAPDSKHKVSEQILRSAAVYIMVALTLLSIALLYIAVPLALGISALVRTGLARTASALAASRTNALIERANYTPAPAATRVLVAH